MLLQTALVVYEEWDLGNESMFHTYIDTDNSRFFRLGKNNTSGHNFKVVIGKSNLNLRKNFFFLQRIRKIQNSLPKTI